MKFTTKIICDKLDIDESKILNIYPYGSKIYGTDTEDSDDDFVIVYKSSLLPSGAFKDNAISSNDWLIQGTCYSRSGFLDAIDKYQINALECIFLPEDKIIQKKMNFNIRKFYKKEFSKNIITTASASWHNSKLSYIDDNIDSAKKNFYHALRILDFGNQILEHGKIINYSSMNETKKDIYNEENFKPKNWHNTFIKYQNNLK